MDLIGKVVLVRTYGAGVHVGELVSLDGQTAELKDAHRVWRWRGENTLHELAQRGADREHTRISERTPSILLPTAIEVLPCTDVAADNLRSARWG